MPAQIIGGLYISDIDGIKRGSTEKFDRVIGVCQDSCAESVECEYEHYPQDLIEAIDAVVAARIRRETVCVHCHTGVSRSAAVCIGALAIVEGMDYKEALARVQETKYIQPERKLMKDVKQYVEEA